MEDTSFWIPPNMTSSPLIGVEVKFMSKQLLQHCKSANNESKDLFSPAPD